MDDDDDCGDGAPGAIIGDPPRYTLLLEGVGGFLGDGLMTVGGFAPPRPIFGALLEDEAFLS